MSFILSSNIQAGLFDDVKKINPFGESKEAKAKKEQEERAAKVKKENEEREAKAKKEREERAAKVKKENEEREAKAKKEREAKAKKEREEREEREANAEAYEKKLQAPGNAYKNISFGDSYSLVKEKAKSLRYGFYSDEQTDAFYLNKYAINKDFDNFDPEIKKKVSRIFRTYPIKNENPVFRLITNDYYDVNGFKFSGVLLLHTTFKDFDKNVLLDKFKTKYPEHYSESSSHQYVSYDNYPSTLKMKVESHDYNYKKGSVKAVFSTVSKASFEWKNIEDLTDEEKQEELNKAAYYGYKNLVGNRQDARNHIEAEFKKSYLGNYKQHPMLIVYDQQVIDAFNDKLKVINKKHLDDKKAAKSKALDF